MHCARATEEATPEAKTIGEVAITIGATTIGEAADCTGRFRR